ncbi:uncharacterized protein [Procambarus clarkii]|uniref:uncharacterized protein n=1 Tax=Procambarus clarkii TaxID=6728 RepID=UPI003742395B
MWFLAAVSSLLVAAASSQGVASECPAPNGFFADSVQCDKYYECVDDVMTEKMCADGLVFVDDNPRIEKCDYISAADCTGRPELQPAQPTDVCPRQNGYFVHPDETVCNKFYFCNAGTGNLVTCPEGLVFGLNSTNCVWPDGAGRKGCTSKAVVEFDCPKVPDDVASSHPRYPDPTDCQYFYVCISGINPRRNGCAFGQVFNAKISACDDPTEVPECSDYYTAYFEDYFKTLTTSHGRVSTDILAAALASGYDVPSLQERFHVEPKLLQPSNRASKARGAIGDTNPPPLVTARPAAKAPVRSFSRPAAVPVREEPVPLDVADPSPILTASPPASRSPVAPRRRFKPLPATTTTTPAPPPLAEVPEYADYPEYAEPASYDYTQDVAAAAAPPPPATEAPPPPPPAIRRKVSLRRPRPGN